MKKHPGIEPKNLTAQLHYRGKGNPPSTHPSTAVSNSYPGLEMDFRNIWKLLFEGIELQEYDNLVVGVEQGAPKKLRILHGERVRFRLISVDKQPMTAAVTGPSKIPGQQLNASTSLEWSNALADVVRKAGQWVSCRFRNDLSPGQTLTRKLKVRHFFDTDLDSNGMVIRQRAVIARAMGAPGALTQSLCSPWQNDYRECGCYYWAASRPDYVNIEPGPDGESRGNNWMEKARDGSTHEYLIDDFRSRVFISYADLFKAWEQELRFIIGGKDEAR